MEHPVMLGGVQLTEPCPDRLWGDDHKYCYQCQGSKWRVSPEGKALLEFITQYGDFAEKEHYHTIS